jgi:hypothetical protein
MSENIIDNFYEKYRTALSSSLSRLQQQQCNRCRRRQLLQHCKKRHLRSVPFLKQFRITTENSGIELNVKESSLKSSEEVFP